MSATPARRLAATVVERVIRDEAWTPGVLDAALKHAELDRREAAFATRLAYGAIELKETLDSAIRSRATRPGRIKPRVMAALRVAAYDILVLGTPTAIAVDQGVALVKERDAYAGAFANAVLRRIAEDAETFPWGDPATDLRALARLTGFSEALLGRLVAELGEPRARAFMVGSSGPPPLYLATNPRKCTASSLIASLADSGAPAEPCEPTGCLKCETAAQALASGVLEDGSAIVADRGAQVVASLVPLAEGTRLLDMASGRGNKSALLAFSAYRAGYEVSIDAVDLHQWKCDVLADRMELLGITNVTPHALDATDAGALDSSLGGGFDAALVDAPCSNLGTLRRHPEQRWRFDPETPERLAALGGALLGAAGRLVRPGGFVVYSTCTVLPTENARVVEAFLSEGVGTDYRVVSVAGRVPPDGEQNVTPEGYYQSLPSPDGPDGHFAALLQRDS